uniref:Uncharacterized protein n=1 Tax=Ailuropoda melanoleuca TaxID=9646 RepID=A0A7N5JCG3_AILME
MLPVGGASTPRKHSAVPNLMEKGLMILQCVACRDNLVPAWKLRQRQQSLSKSAQAIGCFYRKKVRDFSLKDTSFMAELQELRKVFLERPGCPQFSTKATSMSHYGASCEGDTTVEGPRAAQHAKSLTPCGFSTGRLLPFSKSACEFNHLRKRSESQTISPVASSPVLAQSHLRKQLPWYISVIHEKTFWRPSIFIPARGGLSGHRSCPLPSLRLATCIMTSTVHLPLTHHFHLRAYILKNSSNQLGRQSSSSELTCGDVTLCIFVTEAGPQFTCLEFPCLLWVSE